MNTIFKSPRLLTLFVVLILFLSLVPFNITKAQGWELLDPPNTPEARFGHSLVTLPDGRVIMFGGQGENNTLFNDLNFFMDTWTPEIPENESPPERKNHSAWAVEDKMYIHGGAGYSMFYDDLWSYDFSQNTWTMHSPAGIIPEAREYAPAFVWDGDLYLVGGQDGTGSFSNLWSYNIASNTWTKQGHIPMAAAGFAISTYEDYLYVIGYYNFTIALDLSTMQARDFTSSPMPSQRQYSAFVQFDDIAYLFGGEGSVLQDMWGFDMSTETWSQLEDLPIPLKYACAAIYDNQIFLTGGIDENDSINNLSWVYQLAPNSVQENTMKYNFYLGNNYPNPFNPSTKISYSIVEHGLATLTVFNSIGEKIVVLVNEIKQPGLYEITFNAKDLPTGIYFYSLKSGGHSLTKKMVLLH